MRNPDKELLDGIKAIRDARQPSQDQITLRDQFAMAAMNQLLENPLYCPSLVDGRRLLADVSYKVADAMLVERRKK